MAAALGSGVAAYRAMSHAASSGRSCDKQQSSGSGSNCSHGVIQERHAL